MFLTVIDDKHGHPCPEQFRMNTLFEVCQELQL